MKHFLLENDTYVYEEGYLSTEGSLLNKKWLEFVNRMGYLGGVVPSVEADKKCLKRFIDVPC